MNKRIEDDSHLVFVGDSLQDFQVFEKLGSLIIRMLCAHQNKWIFFGEK